MCTFVEAELVQSCVVCMRVLGRPFTVQLFHECHTACGAHPSIVLLTVGRDVSCTDISGHWDTHQRVHLLHTHTQTHTHTHTHTHTNTHTHTHKHTHTHTHQRVLKGLAGLAVSINSLPVVYCVVTLLS